MLQLSESFTPAYAKLLDLGVGREQARGVLVPSVYTLELIKPIVPVSIEAWSSTL